MRAVLLENAEYPCAYLPGRQTCMEQFLVSEISREEHEVLLTYGYRHFGSYYFRPACGGCTACVPVRLSVSAPDGRRSWRRVLNKASGLTVSFDEVPELEEAYVLYCSHKKRFGDDDNGSLEIFRESFFTPHPAAGILTIRDADKLVAVSHFDRTGNCMSAVYTYYDDEKYSRVSPGKLAVLKLLQSAAAGQLESLYLGFYVHDNRFMAYKAQYAPFEYSPRGGIWITPDRPLEDLSFIPGESLLSRNNP